MPSILINELSDKNLNFKQFTYLCIRAFGGCAKMRDEPLTATIPDKFEPDSYHFVKLAENENLLKHLKTLKTNKEKEDFAKKDLIVKLNEAHKYNHSNKFQENLNIYKQMLKKVQKWIPPSKDHEPLKNFMIEQLNDSIDYNDYDAEMITIIDNKLNNLIDYYNEKLKETEYNVEFHKKHWEKEVENTNHVNHWMKQLKESLKHE